MCFEHANFIIWSDTSHHVVGRDWITRSQLRLTKLIFMFYDPRVDFNQLSRVCER